MNHLLQKLYETHHKEEWGEGVAYYAKEGKGSYFAKHIGKGKRVLDLGCRDGTLTKYYREGNEVVGVDIDKRLLNKARKKLEIKTVHLDLHEAWPFQEKFDVVIASEVLEHLFYPQEAIKKVSQILKRGGIFLLSVPNAYIVSARVRFLLGQEIPAHHDPTHINLFSEKKLRLMLEHYFSNIEITGIAPPLYKPFHWLSNGLFSEDLIAKANKKRKPL